MKYLSIVIPCYNEGKNIKNVFDVINTEMSKIEGYKYNILFVDDGSKDDTWSHIENVYNLHRDKVLGMRFSRNFGKEVALSAGLNYSMNVDAVICMDADLQHPPSLIPEFIDKWEKGADIVVGIRKKVSDYSLIKSIGSKLFYKIMGIFSDTEIVPQSTDFRLLDKKVIETFGNFSERGTMFRGLVDWLGFEKSYLEFEAPNRVGENKPSYSYKKLIELAISSIISFSWLPLRLIGYLGVFISFISIIIMLVMIVTHITNILDYTIMAYFIILITFLVGLILLSMGLLALYLEQVHKQVQNRPIYIVKNLLGDVLNDKTK